MQLEIGERKYDGMAWKVAHHRLADELLQTSVIYAPAVVALCRAVEVGAVAHVTGGGLAGNLARVLPRGCDAVDERGSWEVPRIFSEVQRVGDVADDEMARVFNLGIGMVVVVRPADLVATHDELRSCGVESVDLGTVVQGEGRVLFA